MELRCASFTLMLRFTTMKPCAAGFSRSYGHKGLHYRRIIAFGSCLDYGIFLSYVFSILAL